MNTAPPAQNGFLVALSSAVGGVRGWPDADEAGSGSAVWFQGYLADSAGLCTVLGLDSRALACSALLGLRISRELCREL